MVQFLPCHQGTNLPEPGKRRSRLCRIRTTQLLEVRCDSFSPGDWGVEKQTTYFPPLLDPESWFYYPASGESVKSAFIKRHIPQRTAEYDRAACLETFEYIKHMVVRTRPWTRRRYVQGIVPASRQRLYLRHEEDLETGGRVRAYVQPFNKANEKFNLTKYKPSRMIQARHITFNIEYGKYIKPLELQLTKNSKFKHYFGKGDPVELSDRIGKLSSKYLYMTEGDHTTFDAHVTKEMLRVTHKFYLSCFGYNRELMALCRRTLNNNCISRKGDKYRVAGTRMSGDVDTSFGNSLINLAILMASCARLGVYAEFIVNGDDFIIFSNEVVDIAELEKIFRIYNMETKMKPSTRLHNTVEFCRTKRVLTADGEYSMLKDVQRTYSNFGMTTSRPQNYLQYILELTHATWKMNKLNPLGLYFKDLYIKLDELYNQSSKLPSSGANRLVKYQYKYLDDGIVSAAKAMRRYKDTKSYELTTDMLLAYPEIVNIRKYNRQIIRRFKHFLRIGPPTTAELKHLPFTHELIINHDLEQIDMYRL